MIETIAYTDFLQRMRQTWKAGEHVAIVGPTGAGKSYIARDLLELRHYSVVIATKAKDETLDKYKFHRSSQWPVDYDIRYVLLWKKAKQLGDFQQQRILIYKTLDDIYSHGGWSIYFDDLYYIAETLGLKRSIQMLYTQVRSQKVSLIASIQRPRWVPLEAISQSTYLLAFRSRDINDIERLAGAIGIGKKEMVEGMQQLQDYEFLLVRTNSQPIIVQRREK